jgi:hypothetical protein
MASIKVKDLANFVEDLSENKLNSVQGGHQCNVIIRMGSNGQPGTIKITCPIIPRPISPLF